jgi:Spy/CpxP family protein refolding chaperone
MADPLPPRPVRAQLAVIGVFALGIVFGAALSFVIIHHVLLPRGMKSERGGPPPIERMTQDLGLDDEQRQKIKEILDRGHATMRGVLDETTRDIRAVLRPEQREKFDRYRPRSPFPPPHGEHGGPPDVIPLRH